jgi:FtsH-binding integral membrane protein
MHNFLHTQHTLLQYILGAISLYLDIINLFLFMLQLLGAGRRD